MRIHCPIPSSQHNAILHDTEFVFSEFGLQQPHRVMACATLQLSFSVNNAWSGIFNKMACSPY